MAFSPFHYNHSEPTFPEPEPDYSFPTSFTEYQQQPHNSLSDGIDGNLFLDHISLHVPRSMMSEDFEDVDGESKPRLTQAQITTLEEEFSVQAKPRTEYKKILADRLRLDMQRVNNWFQNRRAKAKHQKHPSHESDRPPHDNAIQGTSQKTFDDPSRCPSSTATPFLNSAITTGDFAPSLDINSMSEFDQKYQQSPNLTPDVLAQDVLAHYTCDEHNSTCDRGFHSHSDGVHTWSPEPYSTSMQQLAIPSMFEPISTSWSPPSSTEAPCYLNGVDRIHKSLEHEPLPMYNGVVGDESMGNSSAQTLTSNPSSDDEFSNLMTPPTKTPPMPWVSQEYFPRRESDGSELANGFDTFHLQQPQPQSQFGLGLSSTILDSTADIESLPHTGIATPEASPDQGTAKSATPTFDIASRRKRQRPAALRPDSNRSQSYGEQTTKSAHSRVSSGGLVPTTSVRRIRSTGNNMNVLSGRVSKPGSSSTQMSPRNIQTHFESHAIPYASDFDNRNASMRSLPTTCYGPPTPLSSTSLAHSHSATEWHHVSPHNRPELNWNHTFAYSMPQATSSVPELHLTPPQTHATIPLASMEQKHRRHQQLSQNPPQSAPSHQTTFFTHSPTTPQGNFTQSGWQEKSHTPPETYHDIVHLSASRPNTHFSHHSLGAIHNVPFAPKVQLPLDGPPGMGWFQTTQPVTMPTPPPAVQNGLEIRVDVGPTPMLRSKHEVYTFNNTVPEDLAQPTKGKK